MLQKKHSTFINRIRLTTLLITMGMLTACGKTQDTKDSENISNSEFVLYEDIPEEYKATNETKNNSDNEINKIPTAQNNTTEVSKTDSSKDNNELKQMFGENCITEQTFEVELSEYSGKVYFVALAPSTENPEFSMKIMQNGETLTTISPYVPEKLAYTTFTSLDAVSFYDVNYDSYTDIVTIATYGESSFAAVYYGFDENQTEYGNYFVSQEWLSDHITDSLPTLTIPKIRNLLSDGKKNGSFADYKEAYKTVSNFYELGHNGGVTYDLIYVDNDDIPELVAGVRDYYVSLYMFHDGTVYTLMDDWGYGAMGNVGYEYAPKANNLRNFNTDHAGAILYTTYMAIDQIPSGTYFLDTIAQIKTVNFDDANGNGMPDENEMDSLGRYSVNYLDDKEVASDEIPSFDAEQYEYIESKISLEELKSQL